MPTMAIYREGSLIWLKTFDPPENGVLELEEPVEVEKGDMIYFSTHPDGICLAEYSQEENGVIDTIYYHNPPEEEFEDHPFITDYNLDDSEKCEVDIEFPSGLFKTDGNGKVKEEE
jgi:hypothetical protein